MRSTTTVMTLTALALAAAAPARAQEPDFGVAELLRLNPTLDPELREMPVTIRGGLTVEFRGDTAAGCAITGVCGLAGTVVWSPPRHGLLQMSEYGTRRRPRLAVVLEPAQSARTTAQVTRRGADGSTGRCSDSRRADSGTAIARTAPGRGARISLPGTTTVTALVPDALTTRCAGPLQTDLRGALPTAALSAATLRRGRATIDLRGTRPFTGHGFAGTVHSTITARVGRPPQQRPARGRRFRVLTAHYAIERIDGGVTTTFAGSTDPAVCGPIDACGVTGTVTSVVGDVREGGLLISAVAARRRPWRDLRAAVGLTRRGNPRRVAVTGFGAWEGGAQGATTASIQHPDGGPPCSDRIAPPVSFLGLFPAPRRRIGAVAFQPNGPRTRCAGPRLTDETPDVEEPGAPDLIPIRALRGSRPVLRVTLGVPFPADGYTGSTRTDLALHLRRIRVTRRTTAQPLTN